MFIEGAQGVQGAKGEPGLQGQQGTIRDYNCLCKGSLQELINCILCVRTVLVTIIMYE